MYEVVHLGLVLRPALAGGGWLTLPVLMICSMLAPPTSVLKGKA